MSNMAGVFSEVGAACPSRAPGFIPGGIGVSHRFGFLCCMFLFSMSSSFVLCT